MTSPFTNPDKGAPLQQPTQQPIYPRYPNNNLPQQQLYNNPNHISHNSQSNYTYPQQQSPYAPQQQFNYNPNYQQPPNYQQQLYPNYQQPYPPQDPYMQYQTQNPQQQQPYPQSNTNLPPPIPQNSPLLRHRMSQIIDTISRNKQDFSQQFNRKFQQNEDFKNLNRKVAMFPSILIAAHVIMNRKKKWFRLTVNAPLIRYSLFGLFMLHLSTNILYAAAFKDLIARNREKIQKVVVREEFIGSSPK